MECGILSGSALFAKSKALGELIGWDSSWRHPSLRPSTLSNMNISETSWSINIKFHLEHQGVGGIGCIRFWAGSNQNYDFHGNR